MRRWLDLFRKPAGRAARHPRTLEIVVALSGHPSRTLRINLETLRKVAIVAGVAIFGWFSLTFYVAYSHVSNMEAIAQADAQAEKIAALRESNSRLVEDRQAMGQHMISLQHRVEQLAVKVHGLVRDASERFPVEQDRRAPMGGPAIPVSEANASGLMQSELSLLDERLASLLPQMESMLDRETARPAGAPLEGQPQISSEFGLRANPFGRGHEFHSGMDFVGDTGTPVKATAPGRIDEAGQGGAIGTHVAIEHGYGYRSVYGHLSRVLVRPGETVGKGQVIGLLGNTGRSSGPHLHYALQYKGRAINPAPYVDQ
jgi:murein DD-endopeptidase MepM/ murein hydrolase activator NlpD